jgi:hypothetical protein
MEASDVDSHPVVQLGHFDCHRRKYRRPYRRACALRLLSARDDPGAG